VIGQALDRRLVVVAGAVLFGTAVAGVLGRVGYATPTRFFYVVAALIAVGMAVVVWYADPAYTLSGALCLTACSGHWNLLGLPQLVAPDRFALILVIITVLARGPGVRARPQIVLGPVHAWLLVATLFVMISAAFTGTLIDSLGTFRLLDRFGLLPFAAFILAPVVYRTHRQRAVLIGTLIGFGTYLALTALFQTLGLNALVFPKYILDPALTTHFGRARGPFVQAAVNGIALYTCAIACFIAAIWWPRLWVRRVALAVGLLCVASLLFTLQRSIWIGATLAALATFLTVPELRRHLPLAALGMVVTVALSLAFIPGLADKAIARKDQSETVRGRESLNAAAFDMLKQRPLAGFGWATFEQRSAEHYDVSPDRGLFVPKNAPAHNLVMSNLAELGLVGTTLWLIALAMGVGRPLLARARDPAVRPWRIMLGSVAGLWALVAMASPLVDAFPHMLLWLMAGVLTGMTDPDASHERDLQAPF
jgi:O-antigen ligase